MLAKTLLLSEFLKQLGEKFTLIISKTFVEKNISDYDRYSYYFLSAGISSLYSRWLINPEQENLNNITSICIQMCNKRITIGE